MTTGEKPIYISKRLARNLWQEYRVFHDRLEIQSWICLHTLVISLRDIEDLSIFGPLILEIFRKRTWKWGLPIRLDFAPFFIHVAIHKGSGLIHSIHITPDNPEAFIAACHVPGNR